MNDKQIAELIAALNGLNKTILIQHQSKVDHEDKQNQSRRKDSTTHSVKLDPSTLKALKGLVSQWHKGSKGSSPTAGTEANRRLTGSINNLTKSVKSTTEAFDDLEESSDELAESFDDLNKSTLEMLRQNKKSIASQVLFRQELSKLINTSKKLQESLNKSNQNNGNGGNGKNNSQTNGGSGSPSGNQNSQLLDGLTKAVNDLGFKVGSLMSGITGYISDTTYAMKTGSQFKPIDTPMTAASMGLSSQEYLQLGVAYRTQAMRLSGGTTEWMATIKSSQKDLIAFTGGDMLKAAEIVGSMNSRLMNMGFGLDEAADMIGKGDNGYIGALKRLTYATGKTVEELDNFIGNILTSDNVRSGLFKLDREQRKGYLANQTQMFQRMFEITGSIDRAKQIMDSMNNRQGLSGLDRIRDAAKAAVAARVMGLSNEESSELYQLRSVRPEALTATQNERLAKLNDQMSRGAEKMIGSGHLGQEMVVQTISTKTGQDLKDLQTYNTSLDQPINQSTLESQMASSMTKAFDNPQMQEMLALLEIIKKSLGSNLASIVIGGFASVVGMMAGRGAFSNTGFKDLFTRGKGGGASGGSSGGKGSKGGFNLMGRLGRAGIVGLAAGGGLLAIDKLWEPNTPKEQITKEKMGEYGQGAAIGAAMGSLVAPVIGTALGSVLGMAYIHFTRDFEHDQIKVAAAEHQQITELAKLQKEMVQRKHAFELDNIESFTKTMTAKEKQFFEKEVQLIESQHGTKVKSINDIGKYERDELNDFINKRKAMLQESHKAEMKYIDIKHKSLSDEYDKMKHLNASVTASIKLQKLSKDLRTWSNLEVSGDKIIEAARTAAPDQDFKRTIFDQFVKLDDNFKRTSGWDDTTVLKLVDALTTGEAIPVQSKMGQLAEKLVTNMTDEYVKRTERSKLLYQNKPNIPSTILSGMESLSLDQKKQALEKKFGTQINHILAKAKDEHGVSFIANKDDIISDLANYGQTAFPQINQQLYTYAKSMESTSNFYYGNGGFDKLLEALPSLNNTKESAPGSMIMKQDEKQPAEAENRKDNKQPEPMIMADPKILLELQKQTAATMELIKVNQDNGQKLTTNRQRPKFADVRT